VLSNGENIEPQPIEDAVCTQSDLVCSIRDSRVVWLMATGSSWVCDLFERRWTR
jgi:hypothetical protein